jgi:hypothetical protein
LCLSTLAKKIDALCAETGVDMHVSALYIQTLNAQSDNYEIGLFGFIGLRNPSAFPSLEVLESEYCVEAYW